MNFLQKIERLAVSLSVRAGLCTLKLIAEILLAIIKIIKFVFSEFLEVFKAIGRGIVWIFKEFTEPYKNRVRLSNELAKEIKYAKKEGKLAYIKAIIRFMGSFLFGEDGVCYTAFNYILPIVSVAFLVGIVKYGSSLEYGIAVEYNGKELGIISAETEFETAERDVQQRISYSANEQAIDLSAKFSLRIISNEDKFVSPSQLADKMLAASDEELTEAYGIYIDGNFIGAVRNRDEIQSVLDERLLNYDVDGVVRDVSYVNKIDYTQGIYLLSSIKSEQEVIELLTSQKEKRHAYVVQEDDTIVSVLQKYGMDLDEFNNLNPDIEDGIESGQMLNVIERESYLPIKYIKETENLSFIDYETVEVETSSLNVGIRSVLVKGERGEKKTKFEITYVDGKEASRKVLSSVTTKSPVTETIGLGTYSAMPDSPETVYLGSPLTGTGEMSWPVDGGWISDPFISDRNHKGLDIAASEGAEIYAAQEGTVVAAGWNSGGYGNVVMIEHDNGYATVYAHMLYVYAVEGQYVSRGQLIGFVGTTGDSTGNHCHFEVRYQGICLDPTTFLNTVDMQRPKEEEYN